MAEQRLHSQLAPIDVLTREELSQELHAEFGGLERERYRGLELQRFPFFTTVATAATQPMFTSNDETPCGPEQGDIWMVRRALVKGFLLADTAKYILFKGSAPSDVANAYTGRFLMEGFTAGAAGQAVGIGFYPGTKAIFLQPGEQIYAQLLGATIGNQYMLEGEAIRCPAEMKGKLL